MDYSFTRFFVVLLAIQRCQGDGICQDVTVATCDFGIENLIDSLYTLDTFMCQDICHTITSCYFFRFDATSAEDNCKLFKSNYRESCEIVSAPIHRDVNECFASMEATCDKFMDESCVFSGTEIYVAPPESIADSNTCDELCVDFEALGCTYWAYEKEKKLCSLYDSSERTCNILSGPEKPSLETCLDNYSTTTTSEKTTTNFEKTSTTTALTTTSNGCTRNSDCPSNACDTVTGACYTFKENYACDFYSGDSHSTLDQALDNCNSNSKCRCIDYSHRTSTYYTYTSGTPQDYPNFDAWVKT